MAEKPVALLDMDGTVCDFNGAMTNALNKLRSEYEPDKVQHYMNNVDEEPGYLAERRRMVSKLPGFWKSLPEIPLGMQIYRSLLEVGFEVHVLTKGPPNKPIAWSEKVEWCREHIPEAKITISEDKTLVYGKVLVDDWPIYYNAWAKVRPRGLIVIPIHPWNEDDIDLKIKTDISGNWISIDDSDADVIDDNLESLKSALEIAYHRKPGKKFDWYSKNVFGV